MERFDVATLKLGEDVTEFYMVRSIAVRIGSNGKKYLDVLLSDKTGDISCKKWDVSDSDEIMFAQIKEGDVVKIQGKVKDFNNQLQMTITQMRKATDDDPVDRESLVKAAPLSAEEMFEYILSVANDIEDEDFKKVSVKVLEDNKSKLAYYPAAQRNHHAEKSGLLYHMTRMIKAGLKLWEVYESLNKDLLVTGIIIHDIEKIREIESDTQGVASGYSFEGQMLGHLIQGVKYIDKLSSELDIPFEKAILMEHMVLSHHYEPEFGSPKKPLFPEAEMLHYIDMIDARMYDMEEALSNIKKGDFSDRVWTLDNRRLYKF
ncbi:MAG: OB-fold nucleic acid binding domain-containing protein [Anaerovoracaceae bacterium]